MGLTSIYASGGERIPESEAAKVKDGSGKRVRRNSRLQHDNTKYTVADIDNMIKDHTGSIECITDDIHYQGNVHHAELVSDVASKPFSQTEAISFTIEPTPDNVKKMLTQVRTAFIIDTNFIISHLNILEDLRRLSPQYHHHIVIPLTVVKELDGLKNCSRLVEETENLARDETVGLLARRANHWIYRNLANLDSAVVGQKLRQTIDKGTIKDDSILDCCIYFQEFLGLFVVLLSNDKNLCLKALKENIPTVSFRHGMSATLIASKTYDENVARYGYNTPDAEDVSMDSVNIRTECQPNTALSKQNVSDFTDVAEQTYEEINQATIDAIDYIMIKEYGADLELIGFEAHGLKTLTDVVKCLNKFWISIFVEYFHRSTVKKTSWKNLPDYLVSIPDSLSDLLKFKSFWTDILQHLFFKRNEADNEKLQLLINRWEYLTTLCGDAKDSYT